MKQVLRNERGMALALAIVAIVIVGALVAGALFSGTQEQRMAESSRFQQQSFGVAEAGASELIRTWNTTTFNGRRAYPQDSAATIQWTHAPSNTGSFNGSVFKLADNLYLFDVTGRDTMSRANRLRGGGFNQRLGVLTRIKPLQVDIQASLTTGNSDNLAGQATVDGNDHVPPGWLTCGPAGPALAGVRSDKGTTVSTSGQASVVGSPPVLIDSTVTDTTFTKFGSINYTQLSASANVTLPGQNFSNSIGPAVNGAGQCDMAVQTNWGDGVNPLGPCGTYFPIVHITGDATINGVQGQGILLIDGSLSVQGGFQWFGITIVQGTLKTAGGGSTDAHFWGATMVHDSVNFGTNQLSGHANINYSQCAVLKVLNATAKGALMRSRSWVQLY